MPDLEIVKGLGRIHLVGSPNTIDTDEPFDTIVSRFESAAWQPDGGVSQGFLRTFTVVVDGLRHVVNSQLVTHVSPYERTPF
jgi:hypothetical protein